jgi:hypothetical protein
LKIGHDNSSLLKTVKDRWRSVELSQTVDIFFTAVKCSMDPDEAFGFVVDPGMAGALAVLVEDVKRRVIVGSGMDRLCLHS